MIIIPAIDIIDGKPVRLYKGDYNKKEIVGNNALELAKSFEKYGAEYIHLVDLEGAKEGRLINKRIIIKIANEIETPIEVGGGVRTYEDVKCLIESGISRVILGTVAIEDIEFVKKSVASFGAKIAVAVDCKNGYLFGRGWLKESKLHFIDFSKTIESIGVDTIILTDINKDGTLMGSNIHMLRELSKVVNINIIASGGIKDLEDIKRIKKLNIYGAILGKALYSGKINLREAIELVK